MRNTEIFSRINSENEETYTKDGIEETNIVTNETVVLVGRVKTVRLQRLRIISLWLH